MSCCIIPTSSTALQKNQEMEFMRNRERFLFLKVLFWKFTLSTSSFCTHCVYKFSLKTIMAYSHFFNFYFNNSYFNTQKGHEKKKNNFCLKFQVTHILVEQFFIANKMWCLKSYNIDKMKFCYRIHVCSVLFFVVFSLIM